MSNPLENASDHVVWEYLKSQDADAWRLAWERAVLPEAESFRSGRKAREWGISAEELMSLLYVEMVGARKLELYRDDGGSLWGWMRTYVRGYIHHAKPDERMTSIEGATEAGREQSGDEGRSYEEKLSKRAVEARGHDVEPDENPEIRRREEWELVQKCFAELFRKNPMRAYVHFLRLRQNLSSIEIQSMLGMTSAANVDQTFARAIRDLREFKSKYDEQI